MLEQPLNVIPFHQCHFWNVFFCIAHIENTKQMEELDFGVDLCFMLCAIYVKLEIKVMPGSEINELIAVSMVEGNYFKPNNFEVPNSLTFPKNQFYKILYMTLSATSKTFTDLLQVEIDYSLQLKFPCVIPQFYALFFHLSPCPIAETIWNFQFSFPSFSLVLLCIVKQYIIQFYVFLN